MSETGNLKLKKHDNPETNTEKFDIENYLNGNWDKIDENVGEFNTEISNINSKNTELEKELKEAQEDFYQNSIRGQARGEYIHVEDSSNCRAKIGIGGNSEQETREGYNLLNFKKWKDNNVSWNLGKSIVYGDNYVSGTSEGTDCYSNTVNEQYRFNCEPNTTYTLFYINDNSIMCRPIAFVYDSESKNIQTLELGLSADNIIIRRFTTSSEAGKMAIRLGANVDGVNFKFSNIMILKGIYDKSTIPNYEQYGAMPSPDYPSEIKTVGSNVNILNLKNTTNTTSNATINEVNENDIIITATSTTYSRVEAKMTLPAGTYSFKGNYELINGDTTNLKSSIVQIAKGTTVFVSGTLQEKTIFTLNEKTEISIRLLIYTNSTGKVGTKVKFYNLKLVEGTEVGEYSKFGQGSVKVTKCNKNLFGKYVTGIWFDTSKKLYLASSTAVGFIARVKPNTTYTIKKKNKGNRFLLTAGKEPVKIDNVFSRLIFASNHDLTQYTFTTKENEYYIFLGVYIGTDENELALAVEETQLECGNKATTCEEHKEQSYIMPVQQEMLEGDYFDFDNEEEVHIFGKKVLTGNENWEAIGTNTSGKYRFQTKVDDIAFNADGDTYLEGICDSYKVGTPNTTYLCQESIATVQYYLIIYNEKVNDTVENFKKGLSNKNVTIYYKLATPTRLAFTDEQKAVAKELNNARTYKNVTNITTDSKAILDLDYAKDLETLLNNTQALAVNNASEGV